MSRILLPAGIANKNDKAPTTSDEAELEILSMIDKAEPKIGVFGVGMMLQPMIREMAFMNLVKLDHLRLLDVNFVPMPNPDRGGKLEPGLARVFKITDAGIQRLNMLRVTAKGDVS